MKRMTFGMFVYSSSLLFALCHHIYIHFKLVLSLFNRREATLSLSLSLSLSMLANDEKRKNIRAPFLLFYCLLLINNPPFFFLNTESKKGKRIWRIFFKFRHDLCVLANQWISNLPHQILINNRL
jgi:hypothetical protein